MAWIKGRAGARPAAGDAAYRVPRGLAALRALWFVSKTMSFEWTEALSVGVELIDEQHRELFRRTARLLDGVKKGEPAQIDGLVRFLYEYVVLHFGTEEQLMRETRYRGYARHKAEHDRFVSELLALSGDRDRMGAGAFMAVRLNHWLVQWLKEHVSGTDAELGRYLARRTG